MMKRLRGLLLAPVLVLCAGCIFFTPYFDDMSGPRSSISTRELEFINVGSTTVEEVLLRLGEPQEHYDTPTVFLYRWIWVKGFVLIVVGPGVGGSAANFVTEYTLHIAFDENDRVTRYKISRIPLSSKAGRL